VRLAGTKRFAAVLLPSGIQAVEYRPARGGVSIVRYREEPGSYSDAAAAAYALADLLEGEGARGARLALAVGGFGTAHHLLKLPNAARDLLAPVVTREMRRFYPELFASDGDHPIIDFVDMGAAGGANPPAMRELLAAAVPPRLMREVSETLAGRGIELDHWTVLPSATCRIETAFVKGEETAAVVILLPRHPVLGFFHGGALRLFSEPVFSVRDRGGDPTEELTEQLERGVLFLRQQFRGASIKRLLVASDPALYGPLGDRLARPDWPKVEALTPGQSPGALMALGTALDAEDPRGINLLPPSLRPTSEAERWTRRLATATAAVLILAAVWWAAAGFQAEARADWRLEALQASLAPRSAVYARIEPVVRERREHMARAALLERFVAERNNLPGLLWPLQNAAPEVRVDEFRLDRRQADWSGQLSGTAYGWSSADAAAIVDGLYRSLTAELPSGALTLQSLNPASDAAAATDPNRGPFVVRFRMTFAVPLEYWRGE
jgi:hypothetical protein